MTQTGYLAPLDLEKQLKKELKSIVQEYGRRIEVSIKATIFFEGTFWIGCFERTDKTEYSVARKVFGSEPTDSEVYEFVLQNYSELKFGAPQEFNLVIKRMNPKRMQREVKREMKINKETTKPSTIAQDYMREEIEKHKKEKKQANKAEEEAKKEEKFSLKQQKKKDKHRGH